MTNNSWNYRVVSVRVCGEDTVGIYEVYYEGDTPLMRTTEPHVLFEFSADGKLEGLRRLDDQLHLILGALEKPILDDDVFGDSGP